MAGTHSSYLKTQRIAAITKVWGQSESKNMKYHCAEYTLRQCITSKAAPVVAGDRSQLRAPTSPTRPSNFDGVAGAARLADIKDVWFQLGDTL